MLVGDVEQVESGEFVDRRLGDAYRGPEEFGDNARLKLPLWEQPEPAEGALRTRRQGLVARPQAAAQAKTADVESVSVDIVPMEAVKDADAEKVILDSSKLTPKMLEAIRLREKAEDPKLAG